MLQIFYIMIEFHPHFQLYAIYFIFRIEEHELMLLCANVALHQPGDGEKID